MALAWVFAVVLICLSFTQNSLGKGSEPSVECSPDVMRVIVPMDGDRGKSYLDQMKDYHPCLPTVQNKTAVYILDLQDFSKCGVMRITNSITGKRTFQHKIIIENSSGGRETVTARCMVYGDKHTLAKRDTEPFLFDFVEPELSSLNVSDQNGEAPEPTLSAIVKQNGKQVSGEISVSPGTPLSMEIFLDNTSAPIYGLLVNYMHVTDTDKQQETIIFNGCAVDPYLFENFMTTDGDILAAKFRAFKFPDTTYVQFKGTVTVCLDKCQGVQCSNGAIGYGRKRRAIGETASNKVYEVSLTTFIKVDWANGEQKPPKDVEAFLLKNMQVANQKLGIAEDKPTKDENNARVPVLLVEKSTGHGNIVQYCSVTLILCLIAALLK